MIVDFVMFGLGILMALIGYLLAKRDERRQEEIKMCMDIIEKLRKDHQAETHELFRLRNQDVAALADYKLKIAENHYPKSELDARFSQLNQTMERGFGSLGEDIRAMTKALTEHVTKEH